MKAHIYPGAVLAANHDGAKPVPVDNGVIGKLCPECRSHLHHLTLPEFSYGQLTGYGVVACHECDFEEELQWDGYAKWGIR